MSTPRPSLELLRTLSDEHVLRALIDSPSATRAEIAARTGLSKPTVSESAKRLLAAGTITETGDEVPAPHRRGRVGTALALGAGLGVGLATVVAPEGVVAEIVDLRGDVLDRREVALPRGRGRAAVERALDRAVRDLAAACGQPVIAVAVSVAGPVETATGRVAALPRSPFVITGLDAAEVIREAGLPQASIVVDNDVNWATRAELAARADRDPTSEMIHAHLGRGLGLGLVIDGTVRRGGGGLAGELAHVLTVGPDGRSQSLTEALAAADLMVPDTAAVDVTALIDLLDRTDPTVLDRTRAVLDAAAGALASVCAVLDPDLVLLGGSWGGHPRVVDGLRERLAAAAVPAEVREVEVRDQAPLVGLRAELATRLQRTLLDPADIR